MGEIARLRWLKVETQNTNVAACRFYRARGCVLRSIDRFAYAEHPEEAMLIWYKEVGGAGVGPGREGTCPRDR